jgi:hypothetical protein
LRNCEKVLGKDEIPATKVQMKGVTVGEFVFGRESRIEKKDLFAKPHSCQLSKKGDVFGVKPTDSTLRAALLTFLSRGYK